MKARKSKHISTRFLSIILFAASLFVLPGPSRAAHPAQAVKETQATELKNFVGFFQFPNKVAYIQILEKDQNLVARQVWDGREYQLIRKGDLNFESKDEEYKIEFIKDETGRISSTKILNRLVLTRVNFDPRQPATVSPEKLMRLEGKYQFQKDKKLFIEIGVKDNSLVLKQLWDGKVIRFTPLSDLHYYNAELTFPLTFIMEGYVPKQVICFTNDTWDKVQ